jgi:cytolysin (calcineurin-like family phosphatase)
MRNIICSMTFAALFAAFSVIAPSQAQDATKQMQLTDKQITDFIAAQKEMTVLSEKMKGDGKPDAAMQAQMEAVVKKNGFASFDEYGNVADNISLVMSGIDPDSKKFSEPKVAIQKDIDEVNADKSMSAEEKKQALAELNAALKSAEPVKFPGNVDLVKKHYDELDKGSR